MKTSEERILTTHTGSLPKPEPVLQALEQHDRGELSPEAVEALRGDVRRGVADVVAAQVGAGLAVVNDGEMGKVSYATYVKERLTGFGGEQILPRSPEFAEFPEFFARTIGGGLGVTLPACNGDIAYRGAAAVEEDVANLGAALQGRDHTEAFLTAASPGCIALHLANRHFATEDEYLFALADAMKSEYDAIHQAGFVLQLDCPDLAMGRHLPLADLSLEEFRHRAERQVEALNHAVRDIPADRLRMHLCWGNYEGPHVYDVPLRDIIDVVYRAKPAGIAFESANPRHNHEWQDFRDFPPPEGKVLIPGVIDTTTNFVEHPELVSERIVRLADIVGRERVIAGSDCGFATFTTFRWVDPKITWRKFESLHRGAELATKALWSRGVQ